MSTPSALAGSLIVAGFDGTTLTPALRSALREGRRAGAIFFRRNLPDLETTRALCQAVHEAAAAHSSRRALVSIDQEGGRVVRLPSPARSLPPMRELARFGAAFLELAGKAVALDLARLGVDLDFAPVLDVDSNPNNPVIGDRAFSDDPAEVATLGLAFARGLAAGGVLSCGKHFPGHGDTDTDSHLALPTVAHDRARLDAIELAPFRAAARGVDSLMSAHLVATALDATTPATLSRAVCTDLLRGELGFEGVLFSDDLEMKAVAALHEVEENAVLAIAAGCDALLVCRDETWADRAHAALTKEIERSPAFRERAVEASTRMDALRQKAEAHASMAPEDAAPLWSEIDRKLAELSR